MKQSSVFRIDERVVYSMIAICILSVIILAFKFASAHKDMPISITHEDSAFTNSQASFKAVSPKGKIYVWDFGDGSVQQYTDTLVMHKYEKAGTYVVVVKVDGHDKEIFKQDVYSVPIKEVNRVEPKLVYNDPANVNETVIFSVSNLPKNASIEWYFEGSSQTAGTDNPRPNIFKTAGNKKVELRINPRTKDEEIISQSIYIQEKPVTVVPNDSYASQGGGGTPNKTGGKPIIVQAKPTEPPLIPKGNTNNKPDQDKPEPAVKPATPVVTAPEISQGDFEKLLHKIKTDNEPLGNFAKYFCENLQKEVTFNGARMTFANMYNEIKDAKKRKAKKISVDSFQTSGTTHCIQTLAVSL